MAHSCGFDRVNLDLDLLIETAKIAVHFTRDRLSNAIHNINWDSVTKNVDAEDIELIAKELATCLNTLQFLEHCTTRDEILVK